jgi:hypothetical protein
VVRGQRENKGLKVCKGLRAFKGTQGQLENKGLQDQKGQQGLLELQVQRVLGIPAVKMLVISSIGMALSGRI